MRNKLTYRCINNIFTYHTEELLCPVQSRNKGKARRTSACYEAGPSPESKKQARCG